MDWSLTVGSARKSSPCGVKRIRKREKVRPARQKWPIFGVFGLAGRTFSRFGQDGGAAGRTISRFGRGGTIQVVLCVCAGSEMRVDWSLTVGSARKSSSCGVIRIGKREIVRPARQKWQVFGVFGLAGRTFSRFGLDGAAVGRTFSRGEATGVLLGELFRAATTSAAPAISR